MDKFTNSLKAVAWTSLAMGAAFLLIYANATDRIGLPAFWEVFLRWSHVLAGIMWIGHLYYFNFTQMESMPKIPAEARGPAVNKVIAPAALFWFRWGAMLTIAFGILLAGYKGYLLQAYTLGAYVPADGGISQASAVFIGIGMWLDTIMWFNVWFIIWPNQQKALNINDQFANLKPEETAAAGAIAKRFSRINTLLSAPMLLAMTGYQTFG